MAQLNILKEHIQEDNNTMTVAAAGLISAHLPLGELSLQ